MFDRSCSGMWTALKALPSRRSGPGVVLCGLQTLAPGDPDGGRIPFMVFLVIALALVVACVYMLRASAQDRRTAEVQGRKRLRRTRELFEEHGSRIVDALEKGRSGPGLDDEAQERVRSTLMNVQAGLTRLDERIERIERQGVEQGSQLRGRMEDALVAMRCTGRATVRLLLDRCGLPAVLQDLCRSLEAQDALRVDMVTEGIPADLDNDARLDLYHAVHDAVDCALGHSALSHLSIRLLCTHGRTDLLLANDGGDRLAHHPRSEAGLSRLKARVAAAHGRIERRALPGGGHELRVRWPGGA